MVAVKLARKRLGEMPRPGLIRFKSETFASTSHTVSRPLTFLITSHHITCIAAKDQKYASDHTCSLSPYSPATRQASYLTSPLEKEFTRSSPEEQPSRPRLVERNQLWAEASFRLTRRASIRCKIDRTIIVHTALPLRESGGKCDSRRTDITLTPEKSLGIVVQTDN